MKAELCESVVAEALQDLRDMVRARLPEPQSPGMQLYIYRKERLRTAPCHADVVGVDIEQLLWQGRRVMNPRKETNGAPTSR
jgi:hypothetical protein